MFSFHAEAATQEELRIKVLAAFSSTASDHVPPKARGRKPNPSPVVGETAKSQSTSQAQVDNSASAGPLTPVGDDANKTEPADAPKAPVGESAKPDAKKATFDDMKAALQKVASGEGGLEKATKILASFTNPTTGEPYTKIKQVEVAEHFAAIVEACQA